MSGALAGRVQAIVCDFGGVLTTPLIQAFASVQERSGIPMDALGKAMARIAVEEGELPLFALETGRLSERDFLEKLGRGLEAELGRPVALHEFSDHYWEALEPNAPMIDLMADMRGRGYRMAMLTNNVREWEPRWRRMLPVDEIFEVIVDSAFVGVRKPDPEIYAIALSRLDLPAEACLFVDDVEVNCDAARDAGMQAVRFESNDQAIGEIEAALAA